jgi:hypothetical protein
MIVPLSAFNKKKMANGYTCRVQAMAILLVAHLPLLASFSISRVPVPATRMAGVDVRLASSSRADRPLSPHLRRQARGTAAAVFTCR